MTQIIDRRFNNKNRSAVNRQRFLQRFKQQIKRAVTDAIAKRSITEIEKGEKVLIPTKDLNEPIFKHGEGGNKEYVHPHNEIFSAGDKIKRPSNANAKSPGSQASNEGNGSDEFAFEISKEEFLDLFFDDLALPDLVKRQITQISAYTPLRAGYKKYGTPTTINVRRTMQQALGRRIAFTRPQLNALAEAEIQLRKLKEQYPDDNPEVIELEKKISTLNNKVQNVPFIDEIDLRFNNIINQPKPTSQAVMFCLMDVSGSMDEARKDLAKRFFILLFLFLTRNYLKIELVFIRHHTVAKEVDEHEFFYSRETGGTVVSSALALMVDVIQKRYSPQLWNIYCAQASDGDNWNADSPRCAEILLQQILPYVQYFAYIEILPQIHQNLWEAYEGLTKQCANFAMRSVDNMTEIYPVFRELFKRKLEEIK